MDFPGTLFRLVGYGLLLLALFDTVSALIPFQTGNIVWQYETATSFVERAFLPLLGLMLVFYGNEEQRTKRELKLLKVLSWVSFVFGVFYLLLLLVFFLSPSVIANFNDAQEQAKLSQEIARIDQIENRINQSKGSELEVFFKSSNIRSRFPSVSDPQELKTKLLQEGATTKKTLQTRAISTQNSQRLILLKNSIRLDLSTIVIGILFIQIWSVTRWVRNRNKIYRV